MAQRFPQRNDTDSVFPAFSEYDNDDTLSEHTDPDPAVFVIVCTYLLNI